MYKVTYTVLNITLQSHQNARKLSDWARKKKQKTHAKQPEKNAKHDKKSTNRAL